MNLNAKQWAIYEYLKKYCVGGENRKHGATILHHVYEENPNLPKIYDNPTFKKDIRILRTCGLIDRKIGSSPRGYWLMTSDEADRGHDYIKKLTISHLKTAISEGIPKAYFHKILNEIEENKVIDNQQKLKLTKYSSESVHRYSDDLRRVNYE